MEKHPIKPFALALRGIVLETIGLFAFPRFFKRLHADRVKSILVIADYRVGDSVLAMPMIDALRARWPEAAIVALVNRSAADLWRMHPGITDVIAISGSSFYVRRLMSVGRLHGRRFDLAIDATCDRTLLGAWMTLFSGARYRLGYDIAGRGFLFNRPVFRRGRARHVVDEIVDLAAVAGASSKISAPRINVSAMFAERARKMVSEGTGGKPFVIGVHAGGTYPTQRWMPERFALAAQRLADRHDAGIVFFGFGAAEEAAYRRVAKSMQRRPFIFVNQSLGLTAAAVGLCRIVLCNNSGILHVAAALGVPTVSTMGPTLFHRFRPVGNTNTVLRKNLPCIGCNSGTCLIGTHDCMTLITVEEVVDAAERLLGVSSANSAVGRAVAGP